MKSFSQILLPETLPIENASQSIGPIVITGRLCTSKGSDSESDQKERENTPKIANKWNLHLNLSSATTTPKTPGYVPACSGFSNEVE